MLKTYEIEHQDNYWKLRVQIDHEFKIDSLSKPDAPYTTAMAIKEMVEFWWGWENKLSNNDGDYTKTFLQQLSAAALTDVISDNHNLYGVVCYFEESEGWFPMDGSHGIKITFVDSFEFGYDEFEIKEVK